MLTKDKRTKLRISIIVVMAMLLCLSFYACRRDPSYPVDTYDSLKGAFIDNEGVLFPDLKSFDALDFNYHVYNSYLSTPGCCTSAVQVEGYSLQGVSSNNERDDSLFTLMNVRSRRLSNDEEDNNEIVYENNKKYRGVDIYYREFYYLFPYGVDETDSVKLTEYTFSYAFVNEGYQYIINSYIALPDEESLSNESLEKQANARNTMNLLVESFFN